MCGIGGYALRRGTPDPERLRAMAARLGHRGPDDAGIHVQDAVGLCHTRLSIIDLTGGHQPLHAPGLSLIANGEVYNHLELRAELEQAGSAFYTRSDSEAILHAYARWGIAALARLAGMYAFALYDDRNRRLLLARDRLGIKPLFLAHLEDGIAFASELKALLPLLPGAPQVDPAGLLGYLQYQFSGGTRTVVRGIERLPPGEYVVIEGGRVSERGRYWSALEAPSLDIDQAEAEARFEALMETVMRQHMRTDVPFGLFLSGGVDSAVLLALLSRYGGEAVRTFSVGFADTRLVDELPPARAMAERFASHHTEIRPTRADILHSLPLAVWAADELMRDNANLPTALLAEAAGRELKVVFSGEGGDEVFAGYGRYRVARLERLFKALLAPGSGGFRARGSFRGAWPTRLFRPALRQAARAAREPFVAAWQECPHRFSDLQRMQYTDLVTALPDNLLVKADRLLMAAALEGRVPFLDHRVVEFGLGLPDRLKVDRHGGKLFLKRWAARLLPHEHLYARKRGFHVPLGEWTDPAMRRRLRHLLPRDEGICEWFEPAAVAQLVDAFDPTGPTQRMLWALVQFAVWHRLFVRGDGERPPARMDPLELLEG